MTEHSFTSVMRSEHRPLQFLSSLLQVGLIFEEASTKEHEILLYAPHEQK